MVIRYILNHHCFHMYFDIFNSISWWLCGSYCLMQNFFFKLFISMRWVSFYPIYITAQWTCSLILKNLLRILMLFAFLLLYTCMWFFSFAALSKYNFIHLFIDCIYICVHILNDITTLIKVTVFGILPLSTVTDYERSTIQTSATSMCVWTRATHFCLLGMWLGS